ncbi:MAG: LysM peptidoglycan-binding domain-containing protein [Arenimonas sp.]
MEWAGRNSTGGGMGSTPVTTYAAAEAQKGYWFTYDGENRILVANGKLVNGQILLGTQDISYVQGYDAAGNATIRRAIFSGVEQVEVSQYNLRGQLEYVFQPVAIGSSVGGGVKESRVYDLVGRLVKREEYFAAGMVRKIGTTGWNGSTSVSNNTVSIAGWVKHTDLTAYDKDGRTTYQNSYGRKVDWFVESSYVANGASLSSLAQSGDWLSAVNYERSYDAAGRMMGYSYNVVKNEEGSGATKDTPSGYTHRYAITYQLRGSYLENTNSGWSSSSLFKASTTTSQYDAWGRRVAIREQTPNQSSIKDRVRYYSYDGEGGILRRREGTLNSSGNWWQTSAETLRDTFYTYGNGQQVARQTKDGEFSVAGGPSIEDSVAGTPFAMAHGGSALRMAMLASLAGKTYGVSAKDAALMSEKAKQDKEQNKLIRKGTLDAPGAMQTWAGYGGKGAGMSKVQVQPGETLQTLAQRVYGNSSMWYLLAEANGLASNEALVGGTQISVPDVRTNKNDSTTFKPYNPSEAIGPTSPTLAYVPPPKAGCGAIAMVIMIVIAVVVTVFTAGALTAVAGQTLWAAGTAALSGAMAGGAALGAAFVGGVAGSVASQVVGMAMGVVDHFSLKSALIGGLTSAIGAGVGQLLGKAAWVKTAAAAVSSAKETGTALLASTKFALAGKAAIQGVASFAGGVVARAATGQDGGFSWAGVAAAAVGAAVSSYVGGKVPTLEGGATEGFVNDLTSGLINGAVNASARRLFGLGKQDWKQIGIDAFGNALANAIGGGLSASISARTERLSMGMSKSEYKDFKFNQFGERLTNSMGLFSSAGGGFDLNGDLGASIIAEEYEAEQRKVLDEQLKSSIAPSLAEFRERAKGWTEKEWIENFDSRVEPWSRPFVKLGIMPNVPDHASREQLLEYYDQYQRPILEGYKDFAIINRNAIHGYEALECGDYIQSGQTCVATIGKEQWTVSYFKENGRPWITPGASQNLTEQSHLNAGYMALGVMSRAIAINPDLEIGPDAYSTAHMVFSDKRLRGALFQTEQFWTDFKRADDRAFLKFMGGTMASGVLAAVAPGAMAAYGYYEGIQQIRQGNTKTGVAIAGLSLLGLRAPLINPELAVLSNSNRVVNVVNRINAVPNMQLAGSAGSPGRIFPALGAVGNDLRGFRGGPSKPSITSPVDMSKLKYNYVRGGSGANAALETKLPSGVGGTGANYDKAVGQGLYVLRDEAGSIKYVGRGDAPDRLATHADSIDKGDYIGEILWPNNLSKAQAKGLEQKLMDQYGGATRQNPNTPLLNKYRSFAPENPNANLYKNSVTNELWDATLKRVGK